MNVAEKQKIIHHWTSNVENAVGKGRMTIAMDGHFFVLNNCNEQYLIDVWDNNVFIGNYTHIESFVFDLQNIYCPTFMTCKVISSKKRKRE
jgi:hypothetical protein